MMQEEIFSLEAQWSTRAGYSKEVIDSPFLTVFKTCLDDAMVY